MCVCISGLTLQFGIHGDVREAAQHGHDLIVLFLPQEPQHAAPVGVLETHQVLKAPNFILKRRRWIVCKPLNHSSTMHVRTYGHAAGMVPSWRCSSGGAPPQSGAAAEVETLTPADLALSSGSVSYNSLWLPVEEHGNLDRGEAEYTYQNS